jgi:hypothetical protein
MATTYDISKDQIPASTLVTPLTYMNASQYLLSSDTGWKAGKDVLAMIAKTSGPENVTGSFDCGGGIHCVTATAGTTKRYWLLDGTDSTLYGRIDLVPGVSITSYAENKSMTSLAKVDELGAENIGNGIDNLFLPVSMQFPTELSLTMKPSMAAEQVVRDYFKYWSEGDYLEMEKYVTLNKRGLPWEKDNVESIRLQYLTERPQTENNRKDFVAIYRAKLKEAPQYGIIDDTYTYEYLLKRDDEDSPWLIYSWEASGE